MSLCYATALEHWSELTGNTASRLSRAPPPYHWFHGRYMQVHSQCKLMETRGIRLEGEQDGDIWRSTQANQVLLTSAGFPASRAYCNAPAVQGLWNLIDPDARPRSWVKLANHVPDIDAGRRRAGISCYRESDGICHDLCVCHTPHATQGRKGTPPPPP